MKAVLITADILVPNDTAVSDVEAEIRTMIHARWPAANPSIRCKETGFKIDEESVQNTFPKED